MIRLVPRLDGNAAHREPITIQTDDPYFAIHHATAFKEVANGDGDAGATIKVLTAAWPKR